MNFTVSAKDDSVRLDPLTPCQALMISVLVQVAQVINSSLVVTCGRESHPSNDPHSRGEALDVSVRGLSSIQIQQLVGLTRSLLGPKFTVLYEVPALPIGDEKLAALAYLNKGATAEHIHMQPVKGTRWPPLATGKDV